MRKLFSLFVFVISCSTALNAQKDSAFASVRYTLTHLEDTTWPENPAKRNTILLLGKNMSRYTDFDRLERIKNNPGTAFGSAPPDMAAEFAVIGDYIKDVTNDKLTKMEYPGGKLFAVEEKIPAINWSITTETKEIMGLACQKASGEFKGRVYDAWFCSQLPYSNGPWKLGGLPGLIIEAYDTKKEVIFNFVSFENAAEKTDLIEVLAAAVKTSQKEYQQYLVAVEKDRQANVGSSSVGGGRVVVSGIRVGPDGKPARMRKLNNPIEKETAKPNN
jgi:GLPGLI family protein